MTFVITPETFVISDTHFNHDNIVKYCGRPKNHTEIMESNWFETVGIDDTVLHLGDIFMGKKRDSHAILKRLPGKKYFIRGNHDQASIKLYRDLGFTHVGQADARGTQIKNAVYFEDGQSRVLLTHYPDTTFLDKWTINIHGHIHNNGYGSEYKLDRDYRNVSVEVMDYRPVKLRDILYAGRFQNPEQAGVWVDRHQGEEEGIVTPTPEEVGYYGSPS